MRNTTVSDIHPTTLRISLLTAISAVFVMVLGFAPPPHLYFLLGASALAAVITIATGPKPATRPSSLPAILTTVIPALLALVVRDTSLMWAVVPVVTFVVAAATWLVATNLYSDVEKEHDVEKELVDSPEVSTSDAVVIHSTDELEPKRQQKAATVNEDSSATAA